MGECPKLHSEPLKYRYEIQRKERDYGYEKSLYYFLDDLVSQCDRTVERQQRKLQEQEKQKMENDPTARQIRALEEQAKILGEEGRLEEYNKVQEQINELKKTQIIPTTLPEISNDLLQKSQQHQLKVCEICGCFLSKFESQERLEDHFKGKLHQGYTQVRLKLDELRKMKETWNEDNEDRRSQDRESPKRRKSIRRSRSKEDGRESPRNNKRSRSRDKKSRERRRKFSRSKSPEDREFSRNNKRSRSRDKRKSRY